MVPVCASRAEKNAMALGEDLRCGAVGSAFGDDSSVILTEFVANETQFGFDVNQGRGRGEA